MKCKKDLVFIGILAFLLGFFVTIQIRSVEINGRQAERASKNDSYIMHLQGELETQKGSNDRLSKQIATYANEIEDYKKRASEQDGYTSLLTEQLDKAKMSAGLLDVEGAGVVVTVSDKKTEKTASVDGTNVYVVHQEDLLKIINELNDADAEAISINDERLVATSEVRCAGSTVSVNNRRYSAPFTIKAIGNADNLMGALRMKDGVIDTLSKWLEIEAKKEDKVFIPAFAGDYHYRYAKPVIGGGE